MLDELSDIFCTDVISMCETFKKNKIDAKKLYDLVKSPDLINRRDEFYSLFKHENTADRYWLQIWEGGIIKW